LDSSKIVESDEVKPGIILDFNAENEVVALEVLRFKRRVPKADLRRLKVLVS
jgi:ribosomal 50S subunit-recycling heat shock protein